jgi:hypothetical protein
VTKYRKKSVVIEAIQYNGQNAQLIDSELTRSAGKVRQSPVLETASDNPSGRYCQIKTLEGTMIAIVDDWIIKGVQGEVYPCKPDIFEATYEKVDDLPNPSSEYIPITDYPLNGLLCSICMELQYSTPSGACCINGHGGDEGIEDYQDDD